MNRQYVHTDMGVRQDALGPGGRRRNKLKLIRLLLVNLSINPDRSRSISGSLVSPLLVSSSIMSLPMLLPGKLKGIGKRS